MCECVGEVGKVEGGGRGERLCSVESLSVLLQSQGKASCASHDIM